MAEGYESRPVGNQVYAETKTVTTDSNGIAKIGELYNQYLVGAYGKVSNTQCLCTYYIYNNYSVYAKFTNTDGNRTPHGNATIEVTVIWLPT